MLNKKIHCAAYEEDYVRIQRGTGDVGCRKVALVISADNTVSCVLTRAKVLELAELLLDHAELLDE